MTDATTITPNGRASTLPKPGGVTGLPIYSGAIFDEWDRRLQGQRGVKTWREMVDHPVVGAGLKAWVSLVLATGWHLADADESPQAKELTAFAETAFDDMTGAFADTLAAAFTSRPFGFAILETVYKLRNGPQDDDYLDSKHDDGRIGWADWAPRAQETIVRWEFDDRQRAVAAIQQAQPDYKERRIDLARSLHFVCGGQRKGNPEGVSSLRNSFEAYYAFKNISRFEAIGVERDLAGIPVVWVPIEVQANASLRDPWDKLGVNIRRDEQASVTMPAVYDDDGHKLYDLTLLKGEGDSRIDTTPILARYERLMLRPMLVDFLTLGDQAVGSYAQSTSRTDLFLQSVKGDLQSVEEVINIQGIRRLFKLNGFPLELVPTFRFNELTRRNVAEFAEAVSALAAAGAIGVTEPEVRRTVYEVIGIPLPEETEEEETDRESGSDDTNEDVTDQESVPAMQAREFAESSDVVVEVSQDDIDEAIAEWDRLMPDYAGLLDAKSESRE